MCLLQVSQSSRKGYASPTGTVHVFSIGPRDLVQLGCKILFSLNCAGGAKESENVAAY